MTPEAGRSDSRRSAKPRPRQKRAEATFARLLDIAAQLLEEVGFDKLTTNLICARAGLSPPALYRYFPNKYAVLEELGDHLMGLQNAALVAALDDVEALPVAAQIAAILRGQWTVTKAQIGAAWIMRALHATPQLASVRQSSHREMAARFAARIVALRPDRTAADAQRQAQIIIETGYVLLEMLIDNPDLDDEATFADAATMIAALLNAD